MKMFNVKKIVGAVVACGLVMAYSVSPAQAAMKLSIDDGGVVGNSADIVIQDGLPGDSLLLVPGYILWSGNLGVWSVIVTTGQSQGSTTGLQPHMDLGVNVTSSAGGAITVALTDTGFTLSPAAYVGAYSVTVNPAIGSSANGQAYRGNGNGEFELGLGVISCGPFGSGASSCNTGTGVFSGSPYSMTEVFNVIHGSAGTSSGNFELTTTIPEPASMMLLGSGLIALAARARRRLRRK